MPRHAVQHPLDRPPLRLQHLEVGTEDLHRQRALEPGLGLVDRVLGGLGVVEGDAGKGGELLVDGLDQLGLAVIAAVPLAVGLEADVELGVEEAGRIGAVVRPPVLGGDDGDLGEAR